VGKKRQVRFTDGQIKHLRESRILRGRGQGGAETGVRNGQKSCAKAQFNNCPGLGSKENEFALHEAHSSGWGRIGVLKKERIEKKEKKKKLGK